MSTKRENTEALIRYEIRANGKVTPLAIRLYVENRISYKRFKQICDEENRRRNFDV